MKIDSQTVLRIRIRDPGSKVKNFQFCEICGCKKWYDNNFFHPSLLLLFLDPGSGNRDPGSGMIRLRDKHPGSDRNTARIAGSFLSFLTLQGGEGLTEPAGIGRGGTGH